MATEIRGNFRSRDEAQDILMVFDNPFPTLRAYYDLVRMFQRSLMPRTTAAKGLQPYEQGRGPRVATAVSSHVDWKHATQQCIKEV